MRKQRLKAKRRRPELKGRQPTGLERNLPSPGQARMLEAIDHYEAMRNQPPTVRDLAALLRFSVNGVMCHLKALRKKGYITWESGQPRTLRAVGIVVVGEVS